jgi:hypothetical protein
MMKEADTMITSISKEAKSRGPGRGRRIGVIVLGAILAAAACGIIGVALVQGLWWYSLGTDRALDHESRACVEAIRDEVNASGAAPEAVAWLNAALEPNAHPTDVHTYLLAAREALDVADDPELAEVARKLWPVIEAIRPSEFKVTVTPYSAPTLEWP